MDIGVVVPGDGLEQHGGWIAVLVPTGVIRACITARLIIGRWQAAVGADQGLGKIVSSGVDVVRLDGDDFCGSGLEAMKGRVIRVLSVMRLGSGEDVLRSHVEFHESLDLNFSFVVVGSDVLGAKEAGFLSGIEVKLDWGGGFEFGVDQGAEDFHGIDGAGTILARWNEVLITAIKRDSKQHTSSAPGARPS